MKKKWTNREIDGTIFMVGIVAYLFMITIFSYMNPDFAELTITEKSFELAKYLLIFIAGFTYKAATDAAKNRQDEEKKP